MGNKEKGEYQFSNHRDKKNKLGLHFLRLGSKNEDKNPKNKEIKEKKNLEREDSTSKNKFSSMICFSFN